jgi:mannitol/fructose-specific phosphotransferase system IIA component (Ntr-type)
MAGTGITRTAHDGPGALRLSTLLVRERVKVPLESVDKQGVLIELVDLVVRSHQNLAAKRDAIHRAILERENVLSTGIGSGIAIPHAKHKELDTLMMAAGVSREPIEYGALDGVPARLFFLMLGPDDGSDTQVRVLSRIGRVMRSEPLREELIAATDAEQFLSILEAAEHAT